MRAHLDWVLVAALLLAGLLANAWLRWPLWTMFPLVLPALAVAAWRLPGPHRDTAALAGLFLYLGLACFLLEGVLGLPAWQQVVGFLAAILLPWLAVRLAGFLRQPDA